MSQGMGAGVSPGIAKKLLSNAVVLKICEGQWEEKRQTNTLESIIRDDVL